MANEQKVKFEENQNLEFDITRKRLYDIVVLGASGYTGKYVVRVVAHLSKKYNFSWAVAGRNKNLLQSVLNSIYESIDGYKDKIIDIIPVDLKDFKCVQLMTKITSVVINCVGPYYLYGEIVVKSCVSQGTHYVDVTGESLFMDKMAYMYNNEAEKNGSIIVNALGMESVPADLGVDYLFQKFNGNLTSIDIYMKLGSKSSKFNTDVKMHDGTWKSIIYHLATGNERLRIRNLLDKSIGMTTRPKPNISKILHKQEISKRSQWCLPMPEPDQAVIARSLNYSKIVEKRTINCEVRNYIVIGSLIMAVVNLFLCVLLSCLVLIPPLKTLFVNFPKIFSLGIASEQGPSEKNNENSFVSFTFIGKGDISIKNTNKQNDSTNTIILKIKASNPGYGFASKAVVLGAVTLLQDNIPKGYTHSLLYFLINHPTIYTALYSLI
ncbi:saccharopine dehydrogenase-like oxidoreductase isoform X2 [Daktulosphaira vitifoliae]|uniref:saccharopine dehydrogenase-like oxidoreductase isoform X2 n=1 Tax=Daktulosphaira vitifoliae TaxID=58002 RepID=UPI0021A9F3F3|nr:saccharopine dehydrogenase-like oxidoreductase isoform X2 [Daktulosphaira vitifoliae]